MSTLTLDRAAETQTVVTDDPILTAALERVRELFDAKTASVYTALLRFGSSEQKQEVHDAIAEATERAFRASPEFLISLQAEAKAIRWYQFNSLDIGPGKGFDLWQRLHSDDPEILEEAIAEFRRRQQAQSRYEHAIEAQREHDDAQAQIRISRMGIGTGPAATGGHRKNSAKAARDRELRARMKGARLGSPSKGKSK